MKYGKILESLSENYGVYYFIVDNFKDFLRTFNLNTEFRINKKNWITDSNIRMAIVPTLTFKAYFWSNFENLTQSEMSNHILMKINISNKMNKSANTNRSERRFDHLNNWDDLKTNTTNSYDLWPIPSQIVVDSNREDMPKRSWVQSILINTNQVTKLDTTIFDDQNGDLFLNLFDSSERQFGPHHLPKIYDSYQIIDSKFLKQLKKNNLISVEWVTSMNVKDCRPIYLEWSIAGQTQSQSFAMIKIYRKQVKETLDQIEINKQDRISMARLKMTYRADLIVLPLRFKEFIALLKVREKIERQTNKAYYLQYWIPKIESYADSIPLFYRNHIMMSLSILGYKDSDQLTKRTSMLSKK